jgi:uncharacterized ion transporter superfamily protein YfcC
VSGLTIADIPWTTYMRFIAPLIGILVLAGLVVLAVGVIVPYWSEKKLHIAET